MTAIIVLVLKASIALSVFAIGLKATFSDATYLFRRPDKLVRALLSMSVLMPLFALVLVLLFDLRPAVKIALIVISVSPIPPIFPNKAFKAGGTERYTIGLVVLLVLCALSVMVGMAQPMWSLIGDGTLLSLSAFALVGFVVGHLLGGPDSANRPTLALASASRPPAVALGIAHANFPDEKLAAPAVVLYLLVSGVVSVVYLNWAKHYEPSHPWLKATT